jgi:hypothetical protein
MGPKLMPRVVLVAATVTLLVAAPTAFGGKGGNGKAVGKGPGGSSSLAVVMVDDVNGNGAPNWGDTITFAVSTTETSYPSVEVRCYQAGALAYSAWGGFYDGYPSGQPLMPLWSPSWTSGAADCVATLNTNLATYEFHVDA